MGYEHLSNPCDLLQNYRRLLTNTGGINWEELPCTLWAVILSVTIFAFLCARFVYVSTLWSRWREKSSPASHLLPVDAVALIPQMWPRAWHAWLSRWRLPWRQRAWPVLAHSVTPTVPTYRQPDAKRQRHIRRLPLLQTVGACVRTREKINWKGAQPFEIWRSEIRFATLKSNHISKKTAEISDPASAVQGGWFCCWWAVSNTEKRFAETAHNSSLGTNDSDMQMCLLPFCFPPQPAHKRQGEWKWLIMSLSVSFIYLYAVIKNSFFTKT